MRRALLIPALWPLLLVVGCVSSPAPEDLVLPQNPSPAEPLRLSDVVRLSRAGLSDETIVDLIRTRGIAEQPDVGKAIRLHSAGVSNVVLGTLASTKPVEPPPPRSKMVVRDLYLPLWPVYSGGRFRFGIRSTCWVRGAPEPPPAVEAPEPAEPLSDILEP
jgi:hypothetical protein